MTHDIIDYVQDIYDELNNITNFLKDLEYIDFQKDIKTLYAVIRSLEIIGEAAKHIPDRIRNKFKKIPWKKIMGMRNIITHEYFGVNTKIIWETAKSNIPGLIPTFKEILDNIKGK
jgi:uncharacterized protein with HEPN domain